MARSRYDHFFIRLGLFWAFSVTVMRALRWPNDWAEAHWLINYSFGFLKRALPGTLIAPFLNTAAAHGHIELLIRIISTTFYLLFCAALLWICFRIIKASRFDAGSVLLSFVFLTSTYIVMSAHLNGYYDNINAILAVLACLFVLHGRMWPAMIVMSLAMFVHEAFLLIGYPSVVLIAFVRHTKEADCSRSGRLLAAFLSKYFPIIFIPPLAFACILINQAFFLDAAGLRIRLFDYLSRFEFVRFDRNDLVSTAFTASFFDYFKEQGPRFLYRLTRPVYVLHTALPLFVLLGYARKRLRGVGCNKLIFRLFTAVSLLPLAFHLVASDTGRIWTYPLFAAVLFVFGLNEILPGSGEGERASFFFCTYALIVVAFQLFTWIPLLDGQCERFSNELRALLYAPAAALVLIPLGRK